MAEAQLDEYDRLRILAWCGRSHEEVYNGVFASY